MRPSRASFEGADSPTASWSSARNGSPTRATGSTPSARRNCSNSFRRSWRPCRRGSEAGSFWISASARSNASQSGRIARRTRARPFRSAWSRSRSLRLRKLSNSARRYLNRVSQSSAGGASGAGAAGAGAGASAASEPVTGGSGSGTGRSPGGGIWGLSAPSGGGEERRDEEDGDGGGEPDGQHVDDAPEPPPAREAGVDDPDDRQDHRPEPQGDHQGVLHGVAQERPGRGPREQERQRRERPADEVGDADDAGVPERALRRLGGEAELVAHHHVDPALLVGGEPLDEDRHLLGVEPLAPVDLLDLLALDLRDVVDLPLLPGPLPPDQVLRRAGGQVGADEHREGPGHRGGDDRQEHRVVGLVEDRGDGDDQRQRGDHPVEGAEDRLLEPVGLADPVRLGVAAAAAPGARGGPRRRRAGSAHPERASGGFG